MDCSQFLEKSRRVRHPHALGKDASKAGDRALSRTARHQAGYDAWVHDIESVRPYRSSDETYIGRERELGDAKYAFSDALYSGWLRQIRIPLHQPRTSKSTRRPIKSPQLSRCAMNANHRTRDSRHFIFRRPIAYQR